jgi:N-acetyl-gamma-glutamyl-phosphate reductase
MAMSGSSGHPTPPNPAARPAAGMEFPLAGGAGPGYESRMIPLNIGVVGASGYSGIELLRLLLQHPGVRLAAVTSRQYAGRRISAVFPRFRGHPVADGLDFTAPDPEGLAALEVDLWFLALPHGVAAEYAVPLLAAGRRVIDLSADFRLRDAEVYREFYDHPHPAPELLAEAIYGLPEVRGAAIRKARLVASPGCYPTSVLLPLLPLLRAGLLDPNTISITSLSGASGAGRKESLPMLFCEVNESVRAYGVPKHRHLSEIEQELSLAAGQTVRVTFVPHLIPVTAGIATTTVAATRPGCDAAAVESVLADAYRAAPFVRLLGHGGCPDTRNVTATNFIDIGWTLDLRTHRLILLSAEDNLCKGAASQAIQSMNLMAGLEESAGLQRF